MLQKREADVMRVDLNKWMVSDDTVEHLAAMQGLAKGWNRSSG